MPTFKQRILVSGVRVKFDKDNRWWTVRAVSEHFTALTRKAAFGGGLVYTVIDWDKGIRGPCNLIGQGYGPLIETEDCVQMLQEFEAGRPEASKAYAQSFIVQGLTSWPSRPELEISHRNRVSLNIAKIETP